MLPAYTKGKCVRWDVTSGSLNRVPPLSFLGQCRTLWLRTLSLDELETNLDTISTDNTLLQDATRLTAGLLSLDQEEEKPAKEELGDFEDFFSDASLSDHESSSERQETFP